MTNKLEYRHTVLPYYVCSCFYRQTLTVGDLLQNNQLSQLDLIFSTTALTTIHHNKPTVDIRMSLQSKLKTTSCHSAFVYAGKCIGAATCRSTNDEPCMLCYTTHPRILRMIHGWDNTTNACILTIIKHQHQTVMTDKYICLSRNSRYDVRHEQLPGWLNKLMVARITSDGRGDFRSSHITCLNVAKGELLCTPCFSALHDSAPEMIENQSPIRQTKLFTYDGLLTFECAMQTRPD